MNTPPPVFTLFCIKAVLADAKVQLRAISDSPALDAELLLAHCLKKNQTYLHTWPEKQLTESEYTCFTSHIEKRLTDYPVAYLVGKKAFWTLDLDVTPDVLIPRPETELLVEVALDLIKNISQPKLLDLGTGSGAIALAIASERNDAQIIATDNSSNALNVAKRNAKNNNLLKQLSFIQSNWFSQLQESNFDLIVSNPPYIAPDDPHLKQTIRHEPLEALAAENKGLQDIENIIQKSPSFLTKKGWIIIEHGYDQAEKVQTLLRNEYFDHCKSINDLNNHPRVTLAQKN